MRNLYCVNVLHDLTLDMSTSLSLLGIELRCINYVVHYPMLYLKLRKVQQIEQVCSTAIFIQDNLSSKQTSRKEVQNYF